MQVELAYGRQGLTIEVPDDATVLLPREVPGLADEAGDIEAALRQPLGWRSLSERVRPRRPRGDRL